MNFRFRLTSAIIVSAFLVATQTYAVDDPRAALRFPDDQIALTLHAKGSQIYDCKAGGDGSPEWTFKAPEADLFLGEEKVGHHFAGPSWEYRDGSRITGKAVGKADSARPAQDIPWLRVSVQSHAGTGELDGVSIVLRINTEGGVLQGACKDVGAQANAPYEADYVFVRRP
ncbi:DUF3455 domain-containing protein [Hansschlegelia quercus]|nr:DUF3455 domain-containing protein [Hansschlegelia quercus]